MNNYIFPFLDRQKEKNRINTALNRKEPQLIVLYGRRRCGKSRLITHLLDSTKDIYYHADRTDSTHQLQLFAKQAAMVYDGSDRVIYPDWETLLLSISDRTKNKNVVCFDEFPYLVKSEPSLPSVLQRLIDTRKINFDIILCGSSQQMMNSTAISSSAPLYGRADEIIKIQPLPPSYLSQALDINDVASVEEYAVWGGVPRYWELRKRRESLRQAIMEDVLNSDGILYDEPSRLFMDELRDTELSTSILSLVGNGCNRLSEIASRLERPATNLMTPVNKLISYGYLCREIPFSDVSKNSKKSLYKIADPFLNFYFHYLSPNRSLIEFGQTEKITSILDNTFNSFVGETWEHLCRNAVPNLHIEGEPFRPASRWWGTINRKEDIEIDVVSESQDRKTVLVGECKWTSSEDATRVFNQLKRKAEMLPFINGRKILPILFLKEKPVNTDDSILCLYPDDILKALL